MRAPLSVVIPTLNAAEDLPGCLAALTEGVTAGLLRELVISDGGSADATGDIAQAAGACQVGGPAGRGGQLRRGAAAARGDWLLFLHADTVLSPGWPEAVAAHLRDAPDKAGWFRLAFDARGVAPAWVAGWANLRARALALPYGDQGLLISRALYDTVGGFDDMPLMEDVAIVRRLGRRRLAPLGAVARTGAGRYLREGWGRRGARNLWTLARYFAGADVAGLARRYGRRPS